MRASIVCHSSSAISLSVSMPVRLSLSPLLSFKGQRPSQLSNSMLQAYTGNMEGFRQKRHGQKNLSELSQSHSPALKVILPAPYFHFG